MIQAHLPVWAHEWVTPLVLTLQIALIMGIAWFIKRMLGKLIQRLAMQYSLPADMVVPMRTLGGWLIIAVAALMVLQRLGVSVPVLWTALSGFAAMAAVAFFAAWSVLSNLFCSFLIFTATPFRIGDTLEILDAADKPGVKGRVLVIHLLYTTLEDLNGEATEGALLQIPNSAFFQKTIRRWQPNENDRKHYHWQRRI